MELPNAPQKLDHVPPVFEYQDLLFAANRVKAPENPGRTIHAGTANTDNTGATDNRGYGIGGNRDARGRVLKQLP